MMQEERGDGDVAGGAARCDHVTNLEGRRDTAAARLFLGGRPRGPPAAAAIPATAFASWWAVRENALILASAWSAWRWSASAIAGSSMSSGCRDGGIDQGIKVTSRETAGATDGRHGRIEYRSPHPGESAEECSAQTRHRAPVIVSAPATRYDSRGSRTRA